MWVEDNEELKSMVNNFYLELFSVEDNNNTLWYHTHITYPNTEVESLDRMRQPIEDDEVKRADFCMSPWKAPGHDGFLVGFYVKHVWLSPSILKDINYTDICLIPKVEHPEFVNQFRLISLCNTL